MPDAHGFIRDGRTYYCEARIIGSGSWAVTPTNSGGRYWAIAVDGEYLVTLSRTDQELLSPEATRRFEDRVVELVEALD